MHFNLAGWGGEPSGVEPAIRLRLSHVSSLDAPVPDTGWGRSETRPLCFSAPDERLQSTRLMGEPRLAVEALPRRFRSRLTAALSTYGMNAMCPRLACECRPATASNLLCGSRLKAACDFLEFWQIGRQIGYRHSSHKHIISALLPHEQHAIIARQFVLNGSVAGLVGN